MLRCAVSHLAGGITSRSPSAVRSMRRSLFCWQNRKNCSSSKSSTGCVQHQGMILGPDLYLRIRHTGPQEELTPPVYPCPGNSRTRETGPYKATPQQDLM